MEVTFVAYDIYKQEGGKPFSSSRELLVVQLLVRMTPHVLAKSDSQMMSACTTNIVYSTHRVLNTIQHPGGAGLAPASKFHSSPLVIITTPPVRTVFINAIKNLHPVIFWPTFYSQESSYLPSIYSTVINRANKAPHPLLVSLSFLPPKN